MSRSQRAPSRRIGLLVASSLFLATGAQAAGFGGYFEFGHAEGDSDFFVDSSTERFGFGFALDTAVATDRWFNYRLTVGYQHGERKFDGGSTIGTDGVTINNAFGVGVIRNSAFRFWIGPSIRLSLDVLDVPDLGIGFDVTDVSIGGGPVIGLNWHVGERLTLSTTLAYQLLYIAEVAETDFADDTFDAQEHLVTLNLSFFFRTARDRYDAPARRAARERPQRGSFATVRSRSAHRGR